jgi:hypothetical protein
VRGAAAQLREDVAMNDNHVCHCPSCAPQTFPKRDRLSEGHTSLRFEPDAAQRRFINVYLNGELLKRCFEAEGGRPGWAWTFRDHACLCRERICCEVLIGDVTVVRG